ncbi:hypothetical protein AcV7_008038 [Taiwanofungus camphoratus]|nr:hypothetical protein AcV7_008038 [Antrodia cinnamomea]
MSISDFTPTHDMTSVLNPAAQSPFHTPLDEEALHALKSPLLPPTPAQPTSESGTRPQYSGVVSLRGISTLAFCKTITTPGLEHVASHVHSLTLAFEDVCPSHLGLQLVSSALAELTNLRDLTMLGMPSPESDGWVLRKASFSLDRFVTDLSLSSKDVLDFLARQTNITEMGTTSAAPSPTAHLKNAGQYHPFPSSLVRGLHTLDCPAPFLLSLLRSTPPTRPITSLRVDLNRLPPFVEVDALTALAMFSTKLKRLSLRRTVIGTAAATDESSAVGLSMTSLLNRIGAKRRWPVLKLLEIHDGSYDSTMIPALSQAISPHFPNVETLIWAPSDRRAHAKSHTTTHYIAAIFFMFCRSLRHFVFLEPASDGQTATTYASFVKRPGGEVVDHILDAKDVEDMWRAQD